MASGQSSASLELFQKTTETVANFIRWVAELIRRRNWFMLLVLVGVSLSLAGSLFKSQLTTILKLSEEGSSFWPVLWTVVLVSFLAALAVAVATMPRAKAQAAADVKERRAIKGLRPFGFADAEVFGRLERGQRLQECLDVVTYGPFRFGILMGESGCGKTSFLQAGLWPTFAAADSSHRGIYVRFTEQEPVETIRRALAEQLELPVDWLVATGDLQELLTQAADAADKPLVLLLDQFEQFFVHRKSVEERKPFVEALAVWYGSSLARSVKLLVSIRADLFYQLVELQKALGYELSPQEIIELRKFSPREAARVLGVIAETEQLRFESRFVAELAEEELANREDGLISPVDVQILAWMIERQNAVELRAFDKQAFQKFGGVEGLLTRFLEEALRARVTESQRQAAVKVLLALTDLERRVRAGTLTVGELQQKLKGDVSATAVIEAVDWLVRGDVRLVTPVERGNHGTAARGYELAHERMIPALMRLAGKELSAADRANQLLDRRVNEWLGNDCSGRFLLGLRELWAIRQQRAYLVWGARRRQKEKLLVRSWWRVQRVGMVLLVVLLGWLSFNGWLYGTPQGQIQQVRWEIEPLVGESPLINRPFEASSAAIAFAKEGHWRKGFSLVRRYVNSDEERAAFVIQLIEIMEQANSQKQAPQILKQALRSTDSIKSAESKSETLLAIVEAAGELKDLDQAKKSLLKESLAAAEKINEPSDRFWVLSEIAESYEGLQDSEKKQKLLLKTLATAEKINDQSYRSKTFSVIAEAASELPDLNMAEEPLKKTLIAAEKIVAPSDRYSVLRSLAVAYDKLESKDQAKELLEKALIVAESIVPPSDRSQALITIATAYGELQESDELKEALEKALIAVEKMNSEPYLLSQQLSAIALNSSKFQDLDDSKKLLDKILIEVEKINDLSDQSRTLSEIATVFGELNSSAKARELLDKVIATVEKIGEPHAQAKAEALLAITAAYNKLEESDEAKELLGKTLIATEKIEGLYSRAETLRSITATLGRLQDTDKVKEMLEEIISAVVEDRPLRELVILSEIATASVNLRDSDKAQELLERTMLAVNKIGSSLDKKPVLSDIALAAGELKDSAKAREILEGILAVAREIERASDIEGASGRPSSVLSSLATASGELQDLDEAQKLLEEVLTEAEKIDDLFEQAEVLTAIAIAYGKLTNEQVASDGLARVFEVAREPKNAELLRTIAIEYAKRNQWKRSFQILHRQHARGPERISAFIRILTLQAESENPALINGAVALSAQPTKVKNTYDLTLTFRSPDRNCDRYANWWEILDENGELVSNQRYFIAQPHLEEQPFTETISVNLEEDQLLFIRAHFHRADSRGRSMPFDDYGARQALKGTLKTGFKSVRLPANFGKHLAKADPQPPACSPVP